VIAETDHWRIIIDRPIAAWPASFAFIVARRFDLRLGTALARLGLARFGSARTFGDSGRSLGYNSRFNGAFRTRHMAFAARGAAAADPLGAATRPLGRRGFVRGRPLA